MKLHQCAVVFLATLTLFSLSCGFQFEQRSWPKLVGKTFTEARDVILADDPNLNVIRILNGSPVTFDLRPNRVRVFVDRDADDGIVVKIPRTG